MHRKKLIYRVPRNRAKSQSAFHRNGAAVAELAVTLPIPLLFLLGTIDTGQFANVYQTVSNASLEGARVACKHQTTSVDEVRAAVVEHLGRSLSNATADKIQSVVTVELKDPQSGNSLVSGLANVPDGSPIEVSVSMPYSTVRFISGLSFLNDRTVQMSTIARRQ